MKIDDEKIMEHLKQKGRVTVRTTSRLISISFETEELLQGMRDIYSIKDVEDWEIIE